MSTSTIHGSALANRALLAYVEGHIDGVVITNAANEILFSNRSAQRILGYSAEELETRHLSDIIAPQPGDQEVTQTAATPNDNPGKLETSCRRKDGTHIPAELSYTRVESDDETLVFVTLSDISDRIALQQKLYLQTITDPLTGLFNRRYFDDHLAQEFSRATRYRRPFSTIIIDIDGFKQANDLHGHAYGDEMLLKARDVFNNVLRDGDTVYRYGGDEFAMILPETAKEGAIEVSNRLRERFARQCSDKQKRINLSLSIGIASYPEDGTDDQALIGAADRRMYHSKENGGNMITAFDSLDHFENDAETLLRSMGALVQLMETSRGLAASSGISHSQEIRALAVEIGRRMHLPENRLYLLEQASMLHDIGTIYIPQTIIKKRDRLTDSEWEDVKRHTLIGEEIIGMISTSHNEELEDLKHIIAQHHEWVNGEGYPHGLKGDEIMIEAKILAATDAYNAMTTKRPYRQKTFSKKEALMEMDRLAGTQFDREVVDHLMALEMPPQSSAAE